MSRKFNITLNGKSYIVEVSEIKEDDATVEETPVVNEILENPTGEIEDETVVEEIIEENTTREIEEEPVTEAEEVIEDEESVETEIEETTEDETESET